MKVICAWCRREGQTGYLGEREPVDDCSETHGVCRTHHRHVLAALPSRSFPGVELLLVVRSTETKLFEHLIQRLAGLRGVKVISERRRGDRRQERRPMAADRRRVDRRLRRGDVYALGYTVVRFGKRPGPVDPIALASEELSPNRRA